MRLLASSKTVILRPKNHKLVLNISGQPNKNAGFRPKFATFEELANHLTINLRPFGSYNSEILRPKKICFHEKEWKTRLYDTQTEKLRPLVNSHCPIKLCKLL